MNVIPHVAQSISGRRSAVPDAIAVCERLCPLGAKEKLIEQRFGWAKTAGRVLQVMSMRRLKKGD